MKMRLGPLLATLFCASGAIAAPAQQPPGGIAGGQAAMLYDICLKGAASAFYKPDLADKAVYRLMRVKDDELFPAARTECAGRRAQILAMAADPAAASAALDAAEAAAAPAIAEKARQMRITLAATAKAIAAPGPRGAVALVEAGIGPMDYPSSALRNGETGTSTATFTIGIDGRVSQCSATGATEALDMAWCRVIGRRSLYAPAIDAAGRPVPEQRTRSAAFAIP